ncbi:hypothetical protein KFE98_18995 [bacterium SCSIO 12741]|nr:hypothetical protein KFE98_18995 [bacterium SCSIO 12741]
MGAQVEFTDCSKYGHENILKPGDGASLVNIETTYHRYHSPGTYTVSLQSFSRNSNKSATALDEVTVVAPNAEDLKGDWKLERVEWYEELFLDPNLSVFQNKKVDTQIIPESYSVADTNIAVSHQNESFFFFDDELTYSYNDTTATLTVGNVNYPIVLFNSSTLILKGGYYKGYTLIWWVRD